MGHRSRVCWAILATLGLLPSACGSKTGDGPQSEGGADAGGSGGAPSELPTCTSPELNELTGLVSCSEGYEHRPQAVACEVAGSAGGAGGETAALPRAPGFPDPFPCPDDPSVCEAFDLGYCGNDGGGAAPSTCRSGCREDLDCGDGRICICEPGSPTGGKCRSSDCVTDTDCEPGYRCATYDVACGLEGFTCQRAEDECSGSADCADGFCGAALAQPRSCAAAACGRPFLVESSPRVALVVATGAWLSGATAPETDHLSAAERAALAAHWSRMGQMEHASIAAFARFSLQLLCLGAPPELVEDCTRAMADETAHTRLCFEIASAYAGRAIGPGPLDIAGSLAVTSLADIVELVVVEGCFGETRAALEALEAADAATDPVIRAAYEQIARDEERHAALAFRFVRWALEQEPEAVAARLSLSTASSNSDALAREIVVPCLRAISGSQRAQGNGSVHAQLLQKGAVVARDHEPSTPQLERAC
jgi:hypothetical protein